VKGIDLSRGEYRLEVIDEDMPEDPKESNSRDSDLPRGETLASLSNIREGRLRGIVHAYPPDNCDFCKGDLNHSNFFVDGAMNGKMMWANMCERCYFVHGSGIGWGKGQLYAKQPNGDWLMTGGATGQCLIRKKKRFIHCSWHD